MKSLKRILWANHWAEFLPDNKIGCFPAISDSRINVPQNFGYVISKVNDVYPGVLKTISDKVSEIANCDSVLAEVILREPVMQITYLFFDRFLRVKDRVESNNLVEIALPHISTPDLPKTSVELNQKIDSCQLFNQWLINKLAFGIWGIPSTEIFTCISNANHSSSRVVSNLNFDSPCILRRLSRKIKKTLSKVTGSHPALRLANIDGFLLDKGLFGKNKLLWLDGLDLNDSFSRDNILRQNILSNLIDKNLNEVIQLYFSDSLSIFNQKNLAVSLYFEILISLIPLSRLEKLSLIASYSKKLALQKADRLFFCAIPSDDDIFWIAAAKSLGISVVGVQHSVQYSFISQPCFSDFEMSYCDYFITWGARVIPKNASTKHISLVSLPSPWMSERSNNIAASNNLKVEALEHKKNDFLIMSDRINYYPPGLNTLRYYRLDYLNRVAKITENLIFGLVDRKIGVIYKPYSYQSAEIEKTFLKKFLDNYPKFFKIYESFDKGLTNSLLAQSKAVIWLEPGTGFFECLALGVPCFLLWDRHAYTEESYTTVYFEALERVGVMHSSEKSMLDAALIFIQDVDAWVDNQERRQVILEVMNFFAPIDSSWDNSWREYFSRLQ